MSLQYILDGYNILMRLPELFGKGSAIPFEATREGLIRFLTQHRPQGHNPATVVFDGYAEMKMDWNWLLREGMNVIFSEDESADDRIVRLSEHAGNPKATLVVTDDRELSLRARDFNVKVIPIEAFVSKIVKEQKSSKLPHDDAKKKLSPAEERKITEELRRLWIK